MAESGNDKELKSDIKGKAKVESADEDQSSSTTSSSTYEKAKKCMDAMDFFTQKTEGIVIGEPKRSEIKTGNSKKKAPTAAAGKRRKRAHGGVKRSISLRSGLSEIGMSFDSDSEPTNADVVAKKEQKGKVQEENDVFQGSDTDSGEACKRMKKGRNDDGDAGSGGVGGTEAGAGIDLSSLGL